MRGLTAPLPAAVCGYAGKAPPAPMRHTKTIRPGMFTVCDHATTRGTFLKAQLRLRVRLLRGNRPCSHEGGLCGMMRDPSAKYSETSPNTIVLKTPHLRKAPHRLRTYPRPPTQLARTTG